MKKKAQRAKVEMKLQQISCYKKLLKQLIIGAYCKKRKKEKKCAPNESSITIAILNNSTTRPIMCSITENSLVAT